MTAFASAVDAALLHFLWQGAVVAVVLRLVLAPLAGRSANARYLAAGGALLVLALAPVVTVLFLLLRPDASLMSGALLVSATQAAGTFAASRASSVALLERWAIPLWSLGAAICSLRFLRGYSTVETLRASGIAAQLPLVNLVRRLQVRMGVTHSVGVLISSAIDGPSVIGWLRPIILIPTATVLGLTPGQLEMILAHELAHIRRHDYLVNMLQMGVETILFYHPAVWWISARMRDERELCCDDVVVRTLGDRLTYARALTALERLRLNVPTFALASTDGSLTNRVQRLLDPSLSSNRPMKLPTLLATCLAVALACAAPVIDSPKANTSANRDAALVIVPATAEIKARAEMMPMTKTSGDGERAITAPGAGARGPSVKERVPNAPRAVSFDEPLFDYQVERQVAPAPGNQAPAYPAELRRANIEGTVTVAFVVDTSGHADMSTFKEVRTSNSQFTEAVKNHLPAMVFIPAEVGDHKVKQLVRMPFTFTLSR